MSLGKLQDTINDFNFHIVHVGETRPEVKWVNLLKARDGSGKFKVTYERLTGKIQGISFDGVIFDEVSGLGDC